MTEKLAKFSNQLFNPIDISILVYFRIIFGAIILYVIIQYFANDWITKYWIDPSFHFSYYGFEWVKPWPGELMYVHFVLLGVLAIFIMIGFKYRISTILFFLGFSYVFLLDQATYMNQFYFIMWLSFIMIFVPAHRSFSIDTRRNQKLKTESVHAWPLWFLRAMVGIVYFFAGIAKLNSDWLAGEPLRIWLGGMTHVSLIGRFFTEEWMVYTLSYGTLFLELFVVPFLLWKKTRIPAFVMTVIFLWMIYRLFSIEIFPLVMIFVTLIFFEPDWPRKLINYVRKSPIEEKPLQKKPKKQKKIEARWTIQNEKTKKLVVVLFISFLVLHSTIPLRHHFYPGNILWTDEGYLFSWHMMIRETNSFHTSMLVEFSPTASKEPKYEILNDLTEYQFTKMSTKPDLILQYAHHAAEEIRKEGFEDIGIKVNVLTSLNGREPQLLIDPNVNLVEQPIDLLPKPWIMPLGN